MDFFPLELCEERVFHKKVAYLKECHVMITIAHAYVTRQTLENI